MEFTSGRTCNKVTLWEMIGGHLVLPFFTERSIYFLDFLQQFLPLPGLASLLWLQQFFLLCVPSASFLPSFPLLLIPLRPPSFPLTFCLFLVPEGWHQKRATQARGSHNHTKDVLGMWLSPKEHISISTCTRGGRVCARSCVCVCACVCWAEFTCFTLSRKSRYKLVC